jgi:hypothetical protein
MNKSEAAQTVVAERRKQNDIKQPDAKDGILDKTRCGDRHSERRRNVAGDESELGSGLMKSRPSSAGTR